MHITEHLGSILPLHSLLKVYFLFTTESGYVVVLGKVSAEYWSITLLKHTQKE